MSFAVHLASCALAVGAVQTVSESARFPFLEQIVRTIPQFQGNSSVEFIDAGIGNHVFLVSNCGRQYALKVFGVGVKNFEAIAKSYQQFNQLRPSLIKAGIHTPEVTVFPFLSGEKIVMVTEFLEGKHITDENLPETGNLMGRLHSIEISPGPLKPRFDMPLLFQQCAQWEHTAALKKIWDSLDLSYTESLPTGLIHGDFSFSNVLVSDKLSLIDCDKMRYGYLLDDVGLSQIYFGFDREGNFKQSHFDSFLEEYQKVRPFALVEKNFLMTHVKRCLIEIATVMYYYLYVNPEGIDPNVLGDPKQVERIKTNPNNCFIDPDFMALAIQKLAGRHYQDVFVNGTVQSKGGGPDCSSRYEAIKPVLDQLDRPFSILDIGASQGYFSFRAAHDYKASALMIESDQSELLAEILAANTETNGVELLSKKITASDLKALAESKHFDVVLALNVIHHFGSEWEEAFNAICSLGNNIIIETPPNADMGACGGETLAPINQRLDCEPYALLGQFQRHTDPNKLDRLVWIRRSSNE